MRASEDADPIILLPPHDVQAQVSLQGRGGEVVHAPIAAAIFEIGLPVLHHQRREDRFARIDMAANREFRRMSRRRRQPRQAHELEHLDIKTLNIRIDAEGRVAEIGYADVEVYRRLLQLRRLHRYDHGVVANRYDRGMHKNRRTQKGELNSAVLQSDLAVGEKTVLKIPSDNDRTADISRRG